jgi:tripartite-type tricarboxylate transporter receptor subunit TctC
LKTEKIANEIAMSFFRIPIAACLIISAATPLAAAEHSTYPERPIRMIVPQGSGTTPDAIARLLATELTRQMHQQIVVDNRAGGALMIGIELTARAVPDGYTIGFAPIGALAVGPHLAIKPLIDVRKDLQPIAQAVNGQLLLVTSLSTPFKSVRQVIDYARQNPGKLSYASAGNGTPSHVGFELLKSMTGAHIVHVPYKGTAGVADVTTGQVQIMMEGVGSMTPHVKAGRFRGLAVSGSRRSDALPELPTIAEAGVPGFEINTWGGVIGPAGMAPQRVARLNAEIGKALHSAAVRERLSAFGIEPAHSSTEDFARLIRAEYAKWGEVVKRSGAKID